MSKLIASVPVAGPLFLILKAFCIFWLVRLMCGCKATSNGKLKVAIVKDTCEVWLVNESPDAQLEIAAGELFGFNVGSFTERSAGRRLLLSCF